MRKKLLANYLYFCAMTIFHQSFNSCQAKTVEINAIGSPGNRDTDKVGLIKDNQAQIKDDVVDTNVIQRRQLTNLRQYPAQRLKRESFEIASSRSQRQSNPSGKVTLTSGERRFKKSNHPIKELDPGKLISDKNEQQAINSLDGKLVDVIENRDTQGKRELRKQRKSDLKLSADDRKEVKRYEKSISRPNGPRSRAVVDNLEDEDKAEKSDEIGEEGEDGGEELDVDEKSGENEENAYEDDEDSESELAKNDDEESNAALENAEEEAGKQEMVKREAGELAEEDYDDLDELEGVCEDANFNDDPKPQGQREKDDGRFKRNDSEATKNHAQKNDEDTKKQLQDDSENLEERAREEAPRSGQSDPEFSSKVETEVKNNDELESDKNPKRATPDSDSDSDHKSDLRGAEFNSDYERSLEEQIQRRIDSIKEEIKREVEEKQKVEDIELNNAKYDEIQNETDEDREENGDAGKNSNVSNTEPKLSASKRSTDSQTKSKGRILRRVKRSESLSNADQLRAIEGVDKLSPDVLKKAQLRHESIRKRSAPVYGAADRDLPEISGAQNLMKRSSTAPRRAYVVRNERKRSSNSKKREASQSPMMIPEQAHVDIEDDFPAGLSVDPDLLMEANGKNRFGRTPEISRTYTAHRARRSSAVIPEANVAFVDPAGYRPQDEDENDEGNEFDDDGFEDRTSNLDQGEPSSVENPSNYLFADGNIDDKTSYDLVRRKRAGIEEIANFRGGGGALSARRQTKARANQLMRDAPIVSRRNVRMKKAIKKNRKVSSMIGKKNSDFFASFADSSQELSPRLESEYREAFGGLQNGPSGALARFKRVKRDLHAR